jgi:hypothetical protein
MCFLCEASTCMEVFNIEGGGNVGFPVKKQFFFIFVAKV